MRKVLLDTNAYVKFLAGDENVLHSLSKADIVYISVIVLGELYTGFKGGTKETENKVILEKFLDKPTVQNIFVTQETAEIFGEVKHALKQAGTPLPINDVWLAAHAIETGSVLITYDKHFLKAPGIRIWERLKK